MSELVHPIHLLYAHYPTADPEGLIDFDIRVDPSSPIRRYFRRRAAFYVDGWQTFAQFESTLALPMMQWILNWCMFTRPHQFLILHSAILERNGKALILSGPPGAGKSTLCAALMYRGWRLFSDETAMIDPATGLAYPVPLPVGLKEQSIRVIRDFEPSAVIGPSCPGTRKGTVAHLQPPLDSLARADKPATPAWIVCPRFEKDAPLELLPVSKAETLLNVAHDAFNYSVLGTTAFESVSRLMDSCQTFWFRYGNLDQAVAEFDRLAAGKEVVTNSSMN